MTKATRSLAWIAFLWVPFATGCAPAYRCYSGCYVDCKYCAPQPLPYTHYSDCVCHSCAASKYLSLQASSVPLENTADLEEHHWQEDDSDSSQIAPTPSDQ